MVAVLVAFSVAGLLFVRVDDAGSTSRPDAGSADRARSPDVAPRAAGRLRRRTRTEGPPDILLYTVDTERANHLGAYGYTRATSPALARLANRGTLFEHAYATSSWTAPSVASLVTGVLPSEHGVVHGLMVEGVTMQQEVLSPSLPSLPEALRALGYRTVGVTANGHLGEDHGFARGFDRYACLGFANLDEVRAEVARSLEGLEPDRPLFLWVHVLSPHAPYEPRQPLFDQLWSPSRPRHPELEEMGISRSCRPRSRASVRGRAWSTSRRRTIPRSGLRTTCSASSWRSSTGASSRWW